MRPQLKTPEMPITAWIVQMLKEENSPEKDRGNLDLIACHSCWVTLRQPKRLLCTADLDTTSSAGAVLSGSHPFNSGNPSLTHFELLYCCCLVTKLCLMSFATPCTIAHQAPLSMGFPRQEYWSGLPFPSSGDLPNPGIEPVSPALAGEFFTAEAPNDCMLIQFIEFIILVSPLY